MEYSTCKGQIITYSLASFKANIAKHPKSIDRISLGPVLLLHTTTLMTLFSFRLPFFHKLLLLLLLLLLLSFYYLSHSFVSSWLKFFFFSSLDSIYCNILTCLLHVQL